MAAFSAPAADDANKHRGQVMPLVTMDDVPFRDGIKELARQDSINYILDPAVLASFEGAHSGSHHEPTINDKWTNVTAHQVLDDLLGAYNLKLVINPVTTIARITLAAQNVAPVTANQLGNDTNQPIPLIRMESVPLTDAIRNLANQAKISFILDPALLSAKGEHDQKLLSSLVNIRWENVTAKQGLVAMLDNYSLKLVADPVTTIARITLVSQDVAPVTASQLGEDTNQPIRLISMAEVPLRDAIKNLADQAHIPFILDTALSSAKGEPDQYLPDLPVNIRWQNVTAKQALVALLDNYGLAMVSHPGDFAAHIVAKKQPTP